MDAKSVKISFDLYETVESNEHIQEVHFTKTNMHYFNKHELNGKNYGFLKAQQVFSHAVGEKQYFKMQNVPNPAAEIVLTLSRDAVLKMTPVEESKIFPKKKYAAKQESE